MNRLMGVFALLTLLFSSACSSPYTPSEKKQSENGVTTVTMGTLSFSYQVSGTKLICKMSAPVSGFVAVGFSPTQPPMGGANIIIGYVTNSNSVTIRDDFGDSATSHAADTDRGGTNDITEAMGTEQDGKTEIQFQIPLQSGDSRDSVLEMGKTYTIIMSASNSDDFVTRHTMTGTGSISL